MAIAGYRDLRTLGGDRQVCLKHVRHLKDDMLVATILGVENRDSAEMLKNIDLYISRDQLAPPVEDEFYVADLIGLEARKFDGSHFGRVLNVNNFGAGDVLEIGEGEATSIFILFNKINVPELNFAAGFLTIVPPVEVE